MPEIFGVEWEETGSEDDNRYFTDSSGLYIKEKLSEAGFSWIKLADSDTGTYTGDGELEGAQAQVYENRAFLVVPENDQDQKPENVEYHLFEMDGFHSSGSPVR